MKLGTGFYITGTVTGKAGVKLSGIKVWAIDEVDYYQGQAKTNSAGYYTIDVPASSFTIEFDDYSGAYLDGFYSSTGFKTNYDDSTEVTVPPSKGSINVQMTPATYIRGTVSGGVDGPLSGIRLEVGGKPGLTAEPSTTDATGAFSIEVPAGTYTLYVYADVTWSQPKAYLSGCYNGATSALSLDCTSAVVTVAGADAPLNITLPRGLKITGTVSGSGTPQANVDVSASTGNSVFEDWLANFGGGDTTAADGKYTLVVPAGSFALYYSPDSASPYMAGYYSSTDGYVLKETDATALAVSADTGPINVTMIRGYHIT
jgi:hypothetical protein